MKIIAECGATKTDWCAISSDGTTRNLRSEGINFAVMSTKDADEIIRRAVMALSSGDEIVSEIHIYAAGQFQNCGCKSASCLAGRSVRSTGYYNRFCLL